MIPCGPKWLNRIHMRRGGKQVLRYTSKSILAEYRLRSFSPWLASISLGVAVGGDVVQDPAQVIFIISKNPYSTKPTVLYDILFFVKPTVVEYVVAFLCVCLISLFIGGTNTRYGENLRVVSSRWGEKSITCFFVRKYVRLYECLWEKLKWHESQNKTHRDTYLVHIMELPYDVP